jgi:DNA polymerase I-like protein with 3'-5' exonuclease and polymerase domains
MEIILVKHFIVKKGQPKINFFYKSIGDSIKVIDNLDFLEKNKYDIISFDFNSLLEDIKSIRKHDYVDLEDLSKLILGKSKKDLERSENLPWNIWEQLKVQFYKDEEEEKEEDQPSKLSQIYSIFHGIEERTESDTLALFDNLLQLLEVLYLDLKESLKATLELERYLSIEKPIKAILLDSAKRGIGIDTEGLNDLIVTINNDLYETRNKLQIEYGIFSSTDYINIYDQLKNLNLTDIYEAIGKQDYRRELKLNKADNELVKLLNDEIKHYTNKTILSRLGTAQTSFSPKKINLSFFNLGTVTGRILVTTPTLQQLSKKYRNIIVPDNNKVLIYADYSQFEALILACEANDSNLIDIICDGDIYEELSLSIYGDKKHREESKILFYQFCYGSKKVGKLGSFFKKFPKINSTKKEIENKFKSDGFIETKLGNKRYGQHDEVNFPNWLLSQRIQGNSSLILKKAILSVYHKDKEIEFLLPMHDAVLYQVPKDNVEGKKSIVEECFKEAFKSFYSNIDSKVSFKKFTE